jgi:hypothetical protein
MVVVVGADAVTVNGFGAGFSLPVALAGGYVMWLYVR